MLPCWDRLGAQRLRETPQVFQQQPAAPAFHGDTIPPVSSTVAASLSSSSSFQLLLSFVVRLNVKSGIANTARTPLLGGYQALGVRYHQVLSTLVPARSFRSVLALHVYEQGFD